MGQKGREEVDNGKIGSFIKELRKEKGLTQKELADALHITDRAVSKWERGLNAPDIALLEPLAELLRVSVGELIRGERDRAEDAADRLPAEEAKSLLDYSKEEVRRKVGSVRKKYLGVLAGCLALALLVGGALLWRSGVLFLLDKKTAPDGEGVVRVYSKNWDFWPLRFTLEDAVQLVSEDGNGTAYVSYGNSEYQGLWWSPDGRKYVLAIRREGAKVPSLSLYWLDRRSEWNLNPILNMGGEGTEYQFLQWGKDSESMLFYYRTERAGKPKEGYFWYNCATGRVGGELELPTTWVWGEET